MIPGSPQGPLSGASYDPSKNVTECAKLLWEEDEIQQLEILAQYIQPDSPASSALAFAEVTAVTVKPLSSERSRSVQVGQRQRGTGLEGEELSLG